MKKPLFKRIEVMEALLAEMITKKQAAEVLDCTVRTVENYQRRYQERGEEGLRDRRHSNFFRLTAQDRGRIIALKKTDPWRSARNIANKLSLPVHEVTVWRVCKQANLTRQNVARVKAIRRFEAASPNDLWQTDIMGRIDFPKLGSLY